MRTQIQPILKKVLASRSLKLWLWIGLTAFFLSAFLIVTSEVQEADSGEPELIANIDKLASQILEKIRNPKLNVVAVDLTALGSTTVVTIFVVISSILLTLKGRYKATAHLITVALGSAFLTWALKSFFGRARPNGLVHLVDVQGYSYPSGYSLASAAVYFTFAVLLCNAFQRRTERVIIVGVTLLFISLIALSRVYLGVHYVSDVLAGMLVGIGWAALVGAAREFFDLKRVPGNVG